MKYLFILMMVLVFSKPIHSHELEINIRAGSVYVRSKQGDIQVYMRKGKEISAITHFKKWETIESIFVNPDESYLLVYHRADNAKFRQISLYSLSENKMIASAAPGYACHDIIWLKERILFKSGTTGGGDYIFIYDYQLNRIGDITGFGFQLNVEDDYGFSMPLFSVDEGIFRRYSLSDGKILEIFDFRREMNENYTVESVYRINRNLYEFILISTETERRLTVKKEFPK